MEIRTNEPYVFSCDGNDLAKVLSYYGLLENPNAYEQKIVCPFHEDVNPSMIVDLSEGRYFCFGCNCSGNALNFVEQMTKEKNTLSSIIKYFKILKSKKVSSIKIKRNIKHVKSSNKELYAIAYDYYHGLSKVNWKKDKSKEIVECLNYMKGRGFTEEILNKCKAKVTYNKLYPIIFPMFDSGKFKGWVCRTNDSEIEKKRKYLYNEGFSRATTLVGDYKDSEIIFVVEGYMDRLKFVQFGVENVVAILGWKMSYEQEQKLKKSKVKYIVSALDNDECGRKGTEYLRKIFGDKVIRFQYLKSYKDVGMMNEKTFKKCYKRTLAKISESGS